LVTGKDIESAARIGAVAATYAVEKYGTQEHHFTYDEFRERYRINFGEEI
jgi:adenosine kinase